MRPTMSPYANNLTISPPARDWLPTIRGAPISAAPPAEAVRALRTLSRSRPYLLYCSSQFRFLRCDEGGPFRLQNANCKFKTEVGRFAICILHFAICNSYIGSRRRGGSAASAVTFLGRRLSHDPRRFNSRRRGADSLLGSLLPRRLNR